MPMIGLPREDGGLDVIEYADGPEVARLVELIRRGGTPVRTIPVGRVGPQGRTHRGGHTNATPQGRRRNESTAARRWARDQAEARGWTVPNTGPLPANIDEAWREAKRNGETKDYGY